MPELIKQKPFKPRRVLFRSLAITGVIMIPAVFVKVFGGVHAPLLELFIFGGAVVSASFILAWAAEAAQKDISGGFAIAILAIIAVLPEYAVDIYYAFTAGHNADFIQYAAANMTGSNRLLLGLGWPVVVLVGLYAAKKIAAKKQRYLQLSSSNRMELGFLLVASLLAIIIPLTGQISIFLGIALITWFGFYIFKLAHGDQEEPDLIGTSAAIGGLATTKRRVLVICLLAIAATVILLSAEPFANSLVSTGSQFGIDQFLLVQWLAPLSSEAPEFIIAIIFALRGNGGAAIAMLISSKVNQWTILIGSLPIAYLFGGGSLGLVLDARQIEEVILTIAQTLMGISILLSLRFHKWAAIALLALFAVQFIITSTTGRILLSAAYIVIAAVVMIVHRRYIASTLAAPFRHAEKMNQRTK